MPTTPYARLLTSVNGDTPVAGARTVAAGDTIAFSFESTVGWPGTPLARIEFYSYPEGWVGPGGAWTEESVDVEGPGGSTITYTAFVHESNSAPASFVMPADWGKYLPRLIVNNGVKNGGQHEDMIDTTPGLEIVSSQGLHDLAWQEGSQFSTEIWRKWQGDHAANLRIIETGLAAAIALASSTPANVGSTGSAGVAATASRSDHVHDIGLSITLDATGTSTITKAAPSSPAPGGEFVVRGADGTLGGTGGSFTYGAGRGSTPDSIAPGDTTCDLQSDGLISGRHVWKAGGLGESMAFRYTDASGLNAFSTTKATISHDAATSLLGKIGGSTITSTTSAGLAVTGLMASTTLSVGGVAMTSAATASAPMIRDAAARVKVADPSANDDADTKGARDTAISAAVVYGITGEMAAAANTNAAGASTKLARIDHTHEISAASGGAAGTMSASDFAKLAGIAAGADVTSASVAGSYTAADPADWDGNAPTTIKAALDRIAQVIAPIP